ncbi:MAG: hypothetical protein MR748_02110 [Clostridiales bacterium]|nr:hypothetical protein [Clostridiales bacterium]
MEISFLSAVLCLEKTYLQPCLHCKTNYEKNQVGLKQNLHIFDAFSPASGGFFPRPSPPSHHPEKML